MACIYQSAAILRIVGDDLIAAEITEALGASPTQAQVKGEKTVGKKSGTVKTAKSSSWMLEAADCYPEDLDRQISFILEKLTDDLGIWKSLSNRFKVDLFCGLFMQDRNEGMDLSPESLLALGSRGIKIALNIYGPSGDDEEGSVYQDVAFKI